MVLGPGKDFALIVPSSVDIAPHQVGMSPPTSQRNANCNFQPDNGPPETYTGTMTIVGVDVGFTTGSAIVWGVFTDTNRFAGMLTGTYVGATAQATAVAGIGANALVGGSNHSVALQPLSVQGQVGLNAAGGIGALDLHYAQ
jgi:uncharacterized protein DUF992